MRTIVYQHPNIIGGATFGINGNCTDEEFSSLTAHSFSNFLEQAGVDNWIEPMTDSAWHAKNETYLKNAIPEAREKLSPLGLELVKVTEIAGYWGIQKDGLPKCPPFPESTITSSVRLFLAGYEEAELG